MVGCRRVLGFNGKRERFDRPQVQAGDFFHMALVFLQPVKVHLVRPVHEIDQRKQDQRRMPDVLPGQHHDQPGHRSRCKVIGKNPEVCLIPGLIDGFALGQGDDASDENRIDNEVECMPPGREAAG